MRKEITFVYIRIAFFCNLWIRLESCPHAIKQLLNAGEEDNCKLLGVLFEGAGILIYELFLLFRNVICYFGHMTFPN